MDYDQIIKAIADRVRGLKEPEFRVHRICRDLVRFHDEEVAHFFEELYRGALEKRRDCLHILEALADFDFLRRHFGRRLSNIFDIADRKGLILAAEWLAPLPISRSKPDGGLEIHRDIQEMTLGERKWLARKADPNLIEKLLVDPDPSVICNLLKHPRLLEREVVNICAKTPNHPGVMREVFKNKRWFSRYMVKKALLNNPATPPRLVMLILPWLSFKDLKALLRSRRFSSGFVRYIIDERKRRKELEPAAGEGGDEADLHGGNGDETETVNELSEDSNILLH